MGGGLNAFLDDIPVTSLCIYVPLFVSRAAHKAFTLINCLYASNRIKCLIMYDKIIFSFRSRARIMHDEKNNCRISNSSLDRYIDSILKFVKTQKAFHFFSFRGKNVCVFSTRRF